MNIGIIGNGFVGSAIASGFGLHTDVLIYDASPEKSINSFDETVIADFVFVCVPTPMSLEKENEIDLKIVDSVFDRISRYEKLNKDTVFILKSTVVPGTTLNLAKKYNNLNIVFNPEFLTERSARLDFINASRIVLGGSEQMCNKVEKLYRVRFPHTKIIKTDSMTAEFIKYLCNTFFATKVSFMNEMKQLSNKLNLDWEKAMDGLVSDGRVGNSHLDVPGHDGSPGFGGKCFPKDINALINFYKKNGIDPKILTAAWEKNLEVRKNHDWKKIEGATS
tara:strand:+ start:102 stop:935 length:834 start_codon:yes stop_codon:yes gene_type:complete